MPILCQNRTPRRVASFALVTALLLAASAGEPRLNAVFGNARLDAAGQKIDSKDNYDIAHPDFVVRSTPENVVWGEFPSSRGPVVVIQSGDTVRIETLSHAGATQGATLGAAPGNEANHPVTYLAQFGVKAHQVLQDVIDFWHSGPGRPRTGRGGHILTGPVYVQGAEPGDTLEIQVL